MTRSGFSARSRSASSAAWSASTRAHRIGAPTSLAAVGFRESAAGEAAGLVDHRHTEEDVHQRGLAGPVLAEEGMDLAGPEDEIDVLQDGSPEELLPDTAHLEGGRLIAHGCAPSEGVVLRCSSCGRSQVRYSTSATVYAQASAMRVMPPHHEMGSR